MTIRTKCLDLLNFLLTKLATDDTHRSLNNFAQDFEVISK